MPPFSARPLVNFGLSLFVVGIWLSTWHVFWISGDRRAALNLAFEWTGIGACAFLCRLVFASPANRRTVVTLIAGLGVGLAVFGIWKNQVLYSAEAQTYREKRQILDSGVDSIEATRIRREFLTNNIPLGGTARALFENRLLNSTEPFGPFALANTFAGVLAVSFVLMVARILPGLRSENKSRRDLLLPLLLVAIVGWCLILTKSRTAWVAAGVGIIIIFASRATKQTIARLYQVTYETSCRWSSRSGDTGRLHVNGSHRSAGGTGGPLDHFSFDCSTGLVRSVSLENIGSSALVQATSDNSICVTRLWNPANRSLTRTTLCSTHGASLESLEWQGYCVYCRYSEKLQPGWNRINTKEIPVVIHDPGAGGMSGNTFRLAMDIGRNTGRRRRNADFGDRPCSRQHEVHQPTPVESSWTCGCRNHTADSPAGSRWPAHLYVGILLVVLACASSTTSAPTPGMLPGEFKTNTSRLLRA